MSGDSGVHRRMTGLGGAGNVIAKWLKAYEQGDVNRYEELNDYRKGPSGWFDKTNPGTYGKYVRSLVEHWPHLQLLSDFMDVGTTPVRWNPEVPGGYPEDQNKRDKERINRLKRTRVTWLDYAEDGTAPEKGEADTSVKLRAHLAKLANNEDDGSVKFRLYVVEDLSRDVIEALGAHYDVDPSFFREHIVDYVWYNVKDWWRDPPNLDVVSRGQNWFQIRFSRARYFKDNEAFKKGEQEAQAFNVYRQLQGDYNHSRFWDMTKPKPEEKKATGKAKEARIGHVRSRATFWMRNSGQGASGPLVGILLLDPTIKEGNPVWRHYRNKTPVPSLHDKRALQKLAAGPPKDGDSSFFNDFIYWASQPQTLPWSGHSHTQHHHHHSGSSEEQLAAHQLPSSTCIPTAALLHMVCTEWLTLVDYIKTRLNQVDWEIAFPQNFLAKDEQIEKALTKLHYWRRVVPVFRSMLADTFLRVFRETKHPDRMHVPDRGEGALATAAPSLSSSPSPLPLAQEQRQDQPSRTPARTALDELMSRDCLRAYKQDFALVLNHLEEDQARIDRLTEVVTAVISITDSRRGYKDNKNLQWLTWLATFFIPLSFVATMLSMTTEPIWQLRDAAILWAQISIPSGFLIMSFVMLMSIAKCRRAIRGFIIEFRSGPGDWWKSRSKTTSKENPTKSLTRPNPKKLPRAANEEVADEGGTNGGVAFDMEEFEARRSDRY